MSAGAFDIAAVLLPQARRFEVIDEIVSAFENEYCKITDTQVCIMSAVCKHVPLAAEILCPVDSACSKTASCTS